MVGRHGMVARAGCQELRIPISATSMKKEEQTRSGGSSFSCENLTDTFSDIPPPARPHLLSLFKQHHQPRIKYSNTKTMRNISQSHHHS